MKIRTIIVPTCFGLRPSSNKSLAKVTLLFKHSVKLRRCTMRGDVAACREMACVLFVVQAESAPKHVGTVLILILI